MAVTSIQPANGVVDLGASGTPWTNGYFTNLYHGGQLVVKTNDARLPTSDEKAALAGSSGSPSASNKFLTAEDRTRMWFLNGVTGLTGGGATKLDGYSTTGINISTIFAVMFIDKTSTPVPRVYELVSGTDAESSPGVIRPDDYATTTNEKVWKLRDPSTAADDFVLAFNPATYTESDATLAGHLDGIDDFLATVLTTRTGVYRHLIIPAERFITNSGSPTIGAVTLGSNKIYAATLPDSATRSVFVPIWLPETWDTSAAPKFKLEWASAGASGNVYFNVAGRLYASAADLTGAVGTAHNFTDAAPGTSYLKLSNSFAPTLAGTGCYLLLEVTRTGADASDTLAASAYLTAVHVQYKESTTEPSAW